MPLPGFRRALVVGLVLLALGVGLASTHATAWAQAPPSGTITTRLQPGWNMIGWLGPDTTADELFDAIPALNFIVAWDGGAQRYRWVWRASLGQQALPWIQQGRGLALHIRGEAAVEWTRPAAEGVVLLPLRAGNNLVTWGGPDGTPIEEAVDWLGDAVVGASRWNADSRASERYRPGAPSDANTLRTLHHGDALWVRLSQDANWWQSGTADTEFVFEEPLHPETESALRGEVAGVLAFFYENYGLEPVDLLVTTVRDLSTGANAWAGEINISQQLYNTAERDFPIPHEYFHVLQFHWGQLQANLFETPNWLIEGTAVYAAGVYERERLEITGDEFRALWWRLARGRGADSLPLDHWLFDHGTQGDYRAIAGYDVGALATDWLVRRAAALSTGVAFAPLEPPEMVARPDYDAHFEFFRLLPASASWEEAFEAAFGIAVDDFYEAFEEYRIALGALYLPHLADDRDEPLLLFLGEIPSGAKALARDQFKQAQEFFRDRLGSGPAGYTVFVAANHRSAEATYEAVFSVGAFGISFARDQCATAWAGMALLIILANCEGESLADSLGEHHFDAVLDQVARTVWLTEGLPGSTPWGPYWLQMATRGYAVSAYRDAVGIETLHEARRVRSQLARRVAEPLSSLAAPPGPGAFPDEAAEALSFLAGDWLVARAGEPSIFEYYRLLESTGSWQQSFESAFGITIDDFYQEFAAYRATAAPSQPPPPEEPGGPELVFVGEISPRREDRARADFAAAQAFFGDRLGAEPVDYTVVLATSRSTAQGDQRISRRISPGSCAFSRVGVGLWMYLADCGPLAHSLGELHFDSVMAQLAPHPAIGRPPWGDESRGPYWLQIALRSYAEHAYLAAAGHEDLDVIRIRRADIAARADQTLRDLELYPPGRVYPDVWDRGLTFVAGDWLVARAGELAILEYYRLLPSSDTWQDAFQGAFGITVDDFYAAFAEYRAGL